MNRNPPYFMNIHTGSVDTLEHWLADDAAPEAFGASLYPVQLADGGQVPADFKPCDSDRYEWVEVK